MLNVEFPILESVENELSNVLHNFCFRFCRYIRSLQSTYADTYINCQMVIGIIGSNENR